MKHTENTTDDLHYCPRCAAQAFAHRNVKKLQCKNCGFELFLNAGAAVCALITDDLDRLLVTVRAQEPAQGGLDLPGGFVDPGESGEAAVVREVKEELKLDVQAVTYFCSEANPSYLYGGIDYHTLDLAYCCEVQAPARARAADDVQEVRFLPPKKIKAQAFAFPSVQKIVQRFCQARL